MSKSTKSEKTRRIPHGTVAGYRRFKCRCRRCHRAHTLAVREWRATHGANPKKYRKEKKHGTRSMYKTCTAGPDGGKCEPCRDANREYQRTYMSLRRAGLLDSIAQADAGKQ